MTDYWHETKVAPKKWKYVYVQYLKHKPKITKGKIYGKQFAVKTDSNHYRLVTKAILKK